MANPDILRKLGKIEIYTNRTGSVHLMYEAIRKTNSGIFVAGENSIIDTEYIDNFGRGRVSEEAVDLERMAGNERLLNLLRLMESKKRGTFFPGTLLRDYGGFCLQTMPIVQHGEVICERVKQTGIPYVDDYTVVAERLYDKKFADRIKKFRGHFAQEPMKTLQYELKKRTDRLRRKSLKTININGLYVLPVICNEMELIPLLYDGKPVDVVVHSADSLFDSTDESQERYSKFAHEMERKGKMKKKAVIISAENGDLMPRNQILIYENGELQRVN